MSLPGTEATPRHRSHTGTEAPKPEITRIHMSLPGTQASRLSLCLPLTSWMRCIQNSGRYSMSQAATSCARHRHEWHIYFHTWSTPCGWVTQHPSGRDFLHKEHTQMEG